MRTGKTFDTRLFLWIEGWNISSKKVTFSSHSTLTEHKPYDQGGFMTFSRRKPQHAL